MAHPPPMSIYKARFDRPVHDEGVTQAPRYDARKASAPMQAVRQDLSKDWSQVRKVQPVNYLLPMSIAWLRTLPTGIRPMALVAQYPRIANAIALDWDRPAACRAYLAELLVDHRGARKGFPPDVYRDLATLRDHYYGHAMQVEGTGLRLVD